MIYFIVCFCASIVGAICGIGGGVIIKPVLDSLGILDVATISFLSGCTVLSMTMYSVIKDKIRGESHVNTKTGFPLAVGASFGGLFGKWLFFYVKSLSRNPNRIGAVQAICLLIVTAGTLLYTLNKERVKTYEVNNSNISVLIGIFLGGMSAFLGIGGGPINLVVLFFFFSMSTKIAVENSLYIIFFSQTASLLSMAITNTIPEFEMGVLVLMVAGGIMGGICGRVINKRIKEKTLDRLFVIVMMLMMGICVYNVCMFL